MSINIFSKRFHTKNTKEEKITKKNQGVLVRNLIVKLHAYPSYKNPFFPLCALLFLSVLCERSS